MQFTDVHSAVGPVPEYRTDELLAPIFGSFKSDVRYISSPEGTRKMQFIKYSNCQCPLYVLSELYT